MSTDADQWNRYCHCSKEPGRWRLGEHPSYERATLLQEELNVRAEATGIVFQKVGNCIGIVTIIIPVGVYGLTESLSFF